MAAELPFPAADRFSAVQKPPNARFRGGTAAVSAPAGPVRQIPGTLLLSPVMTGAAGQSSGSRSPEAAQTAARSSPALDSEPCHPNTCLAIRNGCCTPASAVSAREAALPAGVHGNVPCHLAMCALRPLPDQAISGVRADLFPLAVQKPVRERQVATLAAVPSRWGAPDPRDW